MSEDQSVSIFLVEDNDLIRSAVSAALAGLDGLTVVGQAATGRAAVQAILAEPPTMALIDIGLPDIDGIEVTKNIKQKLPSLKAVMLTSHDSDEEMFASFQAGANGYIMKDGFSRAKLEVAIRTVAAGSAWLDPQIAQRVLQVAANCQKLNIGPLLSRKQQTYLQTVAVDLKDCMDSKSHVRAFKQLSDDGEIEVAWDSFMSRLMELKQEPPLRSADQTHTSMPKLVKDLFSNET